ncbi:MAG: BPSS1780 family membrane protein [Thiohalocapsa sp.]
MGALYQVIFTGQLRPDIDPEQVVREFGDVFKVPDAKARELVLSGQERVLKREVDATNAERYSALLDEIGLIVRLAPVGSEAGSASTDDAGMGQKHGGAGIGSAGAGTTSGAANPNHASAADPYAPPAADLTPPSSTPLGQDPMTGPHRVPAEHGWRWISRGFDLFKGAPWTWIGAVALLTVINIGLSMVPLLGGLIGSLLGPVFLGGLMLGAHAQHRGGRIELGDLFAGFSASPSRLFALGGLYLGGIMTIVIVVLMLFSIFGVGVSGLDPATLEQQDPELLAATLGPMFLLALLFLMFLLIPLVMAYWFAPALVVLEDMRAVDAMKLSFTACWRNVVPFLIYGLAAFGLLILGAIPFGLGLLIVSPILMASIYAGYRDIFYQQ